MPTSGGKPKAVAPLLTVDHSKRGRRFITVLDPSSQRVTLLEPWEHAILVLCDGDNSIEAIADLLASGVEGEPVTERSVTRCVKFFEQQQIIEPGGFRRQGADKPPGPRTLAGIQLAYREWHKDPVKTGQILAGNLAPFPLMDGSVPVGLGPTVALPEDEESRPVGIGTTLVLGNADGSFDGEAPALRSVLHDAGREAEPKTEVGSLAEAEEPEEVEDDDLLEIGNVAELLKMVDDDFERQEAEAKEPQPEAPKPTAKAKNKHVPPPVGKAIGGVAEVAGMSLSAERTDVLAAAPLEPVERQRRSELHRAAAPDKALNPTMVGLPPKDGEEAPVIVSPPRAPSKAGDRVGAVIGPVPSSASKNVERKRKKRKHSGITPGALVEDTQQIDTPTDAGYRAASIDGDDEPKTGVVIETVHDDTTTSQTSAHIHARARDVFDRLRRLGLKARSYSDESWDGDTELTRDRSRRRHEDEARAFDQALETLTAGDLEVALSHFRNLAKRLPESDRVAKFIAAIEAANPRHDDEGGETTRRILTSFEDALEGAVDAGRCPQCFAPMTSRACGQCGFEG